MFRLQNQKGEAGGQTEPSSSGLSWFQRPFQHQRHFQHDLFGQRLEQHLPGRRAAAQETLRQAHLAPGASDAAPARPRRQPGRRPPLTTGRQRRHMGALENLQGALLYSNIIS